MTTTDDGLVLLRTVLEHPDDDTPRLVYADWLDERGGHARAEFIRVQCEKARREMPVRDTPRPGGRWVEFDHGADYDALRRRERELLDAEQPVPGVEGWKLTNRVIWAFGRSLYHIALTVALSPEFRRGFIDALTLSAADWLAHADVLAWHPGQAVPCPQAGYDEGEPHALCARCRGKGSVPRPMPPTAQPVRRVVLTTRPEWCHRGGAVYLFTGPVPPHGRTPTPGHRCQNSTPDTPGVGVVPSTGNPGRQYVVGLLEREWPGIAFDLPPGRG